jgi:hypothetical protein
MPFFIRRVAAVLASLAGVGLASGCGGAAPAPTHSAETAAEDTPAAVERPEVEPPDTDDAVLRAEVDAEVVYSPDADRWTVTWHFDEPTTGMLFDQASPAPRAEWTVDAGLAWGEQVLGKDVLAATDGQPRTRFSASFPTQAPMTRYSASFMQTFSDGGRLLYVAQVATHAYAPERERAPVRGLGQPRTWRFRVEGDWQIHVQGAGAPRHLLWEQPGGDYRGAIVYFGPGQPRHVAGAHLLLDPELPAWLTPEIDRQLPRFLTFFDERLGYRPEREPTVFVTWNRTWPMPDHRGHCVGGDSALELVGRTWATGSPSSQSLWRRFLAHELFHLWNSRARGTASTRWLVEGAAEYAAVVAEHDAGWLPEPDMRRWLQQRSQACMRGLDRALAEPLSNRSLYYSCGAVLLFLADRELEPAGGLFPLLSTIYRRADTGRQYDEQTFLSSLDRRVADPRVTDSRLGAFIRTLLRQGFGRNGHQELRRRMAAAGIELSAPGR